MKPLIAVLALALLLAATPLSAQVALEPEVRNGLALLGIQPADVADIVTFTYGEFFISTSGKTFIHAKTLERWLADIKATTPDQLLLFKGFYDSIPFPNRKMNSSENYNLAEDRPMPGYRYAVGLVGKGLIRFASLLPPDSGKREVKMWRITLKPEAPLPTYATEEQLNAVQQDLGSVAGRVKTLEETQYRPPEPPPPHFDGMHFFAGYGGQKAGPEVASGVNLSFIVPMLEQVLFGAIVNGAYQGQGGITAYMDVFFDVTPGAERGIGGIVAGASVSFYRNLDKSLPAPYRTLKYGGPYAGARLYLPFIGDRVIEVSLLITPSAEILVSKAGIRMTEWTVGGGLRAALMVF